MSKQLSSFVRWVETVDDQSPQFDRWLATALIVCGVPESPRYVTLTWMALSTCVGVGLFVFTDNVLLALCSTLAVLTLCPLTLWLWRAARVRSFHRQLPTAVTLLARSIESGDSFVSALLKVGQRIPNPLGNELRQFARQLELGLPMEQFFQRLNQRYRSADVRMLGSTLLTHERSGGDLSHMLNRLELVLSDRRKYRELVDSASITARLSAITIGLAGPALLVYYLVQQEYAKDILNNETARSYIALAVGLEVVGILWVFALARRQI